MYSSESLSGAPAVRPQISVSRSGTAALPLRFLGEPILDAGLVACLLHAKKDDPSQLTQEDWQSWLEELEEDYEKNYLSAYLDVAFTRNGFNNPSWKGTARKQKLSEIFALARGERPPYTEDSDPRPPADTKCVFYPEEEAVMLAARDRFPMLTGRGTLNFTPNGGGYLPLSPWALGCLLGFFYTAPLISGRFLLAHTLSPKLLYTLLRTLKVKYVDRVLILSKAQGEKLSLQRPLSRFGEVLSEVLDGKLREMADTDLAPIIVFHLSNSGQSPDAEIFRYVPSVQRFLKRMKAQRFKSSWEALVRSFWVGQRKRGKLHLPPQAQDISPTQGDDLESLTSRNLLYEKLPNLPDEAPLFVRYFFRAYAYRNLTPVKRYARIGGEDVPALEALKDSPYEPLWDVVEAFCTHFFSHMTAEKIEKIRSLAEKIADLIVEGLEPGAYRDVLGLSNINVNRYDRWRGLLLKLLRRYLNAKNELLFSLEAFLQLFEQVEGYPETDWQLSRDLVQIALLEELHKRGYFEKHPEAREELATETLTNETN